MRHVLPVVALLLAGLALAEPASAASVFASPPPTFKDVLAQAVADGKPVFVDFWAAGCGWCVKLERDTFPDQSVEKALSRFVTLRVDVEEGEGPALAKRYHVVGFPTLLVTDAAGEEIDRIQGYLPPVGFVEELERIESGRDTLKSLRERHDADPSDLDVAFALGTKLATSRPSEVAAYYGSLERSLRAGSRVVRARVQLERAAALAEAGDDEEAARTAERLVRSYPDTPAAGQAARRAGRAFLQLDFARGMRFLDSVRRLATEREDRVGVERWTVALHEGAIIESLRRRAEAAGDDADMLRETASKCLELRLLVAETFDWARSAVNGSGRAPAALDTLANLDWLVGDFDEALALEEEAEGKAADPGSLRKYRATLARWRAERAVLEAETPAVPTAAGEREDGGVAAGGVAAGG